MAVIIGGNTLITFDSTGGGSQQAEVAKAVKEKIKFILLTSKGEIPNDPDYGANLIEFCFAPIDDVVESLIETTCRAELAQRLHYVTVLEVVFKKVDPGILSFTLKYELTPGWEDYVDIILSGGS
jgi:phage baseplate assembly protein W